jgi:hypothetical protein
MGDAPAHGSECADRISWGGLSRDVNGQAGSVLRMEAVTIFADACPED